MRTTLFLNLICAGSLFTAGAAWAGPECTKEPKTAWKDQADFQNGLKAEGYEIVKFKVTSGNCYEIYGKNKDGKKVEIYFNPVDGTKVKEKIQ